MSTTITSIYDVIVIGSGPAGCAAAGTCTKAGLNVLMVTDRSKPDALPVVVPGPLESIHPGVSSLLIKIGAEGAEFDATLALYSGIHAGDKYTPLGEDSTGIWQGMHINREIFNAQLLFRIQQLGVNVIFSEKVEDVIISKEQVERGDDPAMTKDMKRESREQERYKDTANIIGIKTRFGDLHAKYIIDASGKKAIAGKMMKLKRRFFSPPLVCWTGISKIDETFSYDLSAAHFIPHKDGWTWLAPQPPDYCAWTRLSMKGEKSFLAPEELKNNTTFNTIHFANMRWRLFRPVCSEGIILCGDAAGILDPAAGQGIFNALLSGITAANTVVKCIQESHLAAFHLAHYDDWFVREFEVKVEKLRLYYEEKGITVFGRELGAGMDD